MIHRNPALPDNIFALQRHETIGDYARAYRDEIARAYEDLNLIYIPYFPLDIDFPFWNAVIMPEPLKKVGSRDGLGNSLFLHNADHTFSVDQAHILRAMIGDNLALAGYMQTQVASVNAQIGLALRVLFPRYYSFGDSNITWRFTPTRDEAMHVDSFLRGKPSNAVDRRSFRVKLFINVDSEPRKWRVSYTMPELLKRYRAKFPDALPDDAELVAYKINLTGILRDAPYHEVDIPPMGAVIGEGGALAHQVVYGNRVIAAEFLCEARDMLTPAKATYASVPRWLAAAGIAVDPAGVLPDAPGQDIYGTAT